MKNLITPTGLRIAGRFLQAGEAVPGDVIGFDYEKAARKGMIEAQDGAEIKNPEAQTAPAESTPVTDALAGLKEQHEAALKAEQDKTALWQSRAHEQDAKVATLTKDVARLQGELEKAQASAVKPEDAAALAEYREVVGDLLPHDFPARKILLENGYYTPKTVQAASDGELNGLKGISDAKLADIRKVAPYTGGE